MGVTGQGGGRLQAGSLRWAMKIITLAADALLTLRPSSAYADTTGGGIPNRSHSSRSPRSACEAGDRRRTDSCHDADGERSASPLYASTSKLGYVAPRLINEAAELDDVRKGRVLNDTREIALNGGWVNVALARLAA